ncbi:hypothetical protein JCM11641_007975 [Rhodosporidiobolus odoratus]
MAKAKQPLQQTKAPVKPLQWPRLTPPPPHSPLDLVQISPGILILDNLFQTQLRKSLLTFLKANIKLNPPVAPKRGEAARTNERISLQDQGFANQLWTDTGLDKACQSIEGNNGRTAVGLNPNIRIYRYAEGSYFGPHYDDDFHAPETGTTSEWTLLVYLTGKEDGVVGGETAFYPTPTRKDNGPAIVPELKAGRALLHRHGLACALHEGRLVEKGEKWVLRSDVMFR